MRSLLACCLLSFASACAAEPAFAPALNPGGPHRVYGDWQASAIGGGGYIVGVAPTSDPARMYAWTDVGGAHTSEDGGETWRNMTGTLPYGGASESRGMLYCRDLLTHPDEPETVFVAIGYHWSPAYGVYRSRDAGLHWERVLEMWFCGDDATRGLGSVLRRSPSDPETIWAAGLNTRPAVSRDGGATWTVPGAGEAGEAPRTTPAALLIDAGDADRVWVSGEETLTWVLPAHANDDAGEKLDLPGGLWRTDDGGRTWVRLLDDPASGDLAQDPGDPGVIYGIFAGGTSVRSSEDGGETWSPLEAGLPLLGGRPKPPVPDSAVYSNLTIDRGVVYLLSSRGDVHRLDRAAQRWERLGPDRFVEPEGWWGATADDPSAGGDWVTSGAAAACLAFSPHEPGVFWVSDWYSIYRTDDGGATFVNRTDGVEVTYIDCLEQDPTDPTRVHMGMADNGYFRSDDAGAAFAGFTHDEDISNNIKSLSLPAGDPDRLYALGPAPPGGGWYAGHLFVSRDAGSSWTPSPMTGLPPVSEGGFHGHTVLADDAEPDTVFVAISQAVEAGGGGGGAYVSHDGGQTFSFFGRGLPVGVPFFRHDAWGGGKEIARNARGVMLANSIEEGRLFRRLPGDEAWAELPHPADAGFNDVRADPHRPNRFWATGSEAGCWRSEDEGRTWRRVAIPAATPGPKHLILDRVVPDRIALGTSHGVCLSRDGGQAWEVLDQTLPGRVDWNKGAFAGDRLVVGSGGTGCYWTELDAP